MSPAITSVPGASIAAIEAAFQRAFSSTISDGSPAVISSTLGSVTSNSTPSASSSALRWGERDASTTFILRRGLRPGTSQLGEPDPDLALG